MTRILITGASGFLGLPIVREFVKQKEYQVYAVTSGLRAVEFPEGVIRVNVNLLDRDATKEIIESVRPEIMLHLAWDLSKPDYPNAQSNLIWLEESLFMLRAFIASGGRYFAFSGSSAEYGRFTGFAEGGTAVALSLYGQCKRSFHEAAMRVSQTGIVSYVNLRFFPILGRGVRKNIAAAAKAAAAFEAREKFVCKAPNNIWDFIAVDDAARAAYAVIKQGCTGVVNIGRGKPLMMGEVFKIIAKKMSCEELLVLEDTDVRSEILVADIGVLNCVVGYRCLVGLDKMLDETIASVRQRGMLSAGK